MFTCSLIIAHHDRGGKKGNERDSELTVNLPPTGISDSTYAFLLHIVTKLTDLLEKNNLLQNEIRQLRETQLRMYMKRSNRDY